MGENHDTLAEPSRVTSVTVDQYAALGQKVRLDLGKRRTVLVGHNGAGKSALLEAISRAFRNALSAGTDEAKAEPFVFELSMETGFGHTEYGYLIRQMQRAPGAVHSAWSEKLRLNGKELWRHQSGQSSWDEVEAGQVSTAIYLLADFHLLEILVSQLSALPEGVTLSSVARPVMDLCSFSTHVPAGVPRAPGERTPLTFLLDRESRQWTPTTSERSRVISLFGEILKAWGEDRATFDEFVAVCIRVGIFAEFDFVEFSPPASASTEQRLGALLCDGLNAAVLSDGTLRVMEIIWALLSTRPGALMMIEEPETGIHPGLLVALLNEIDAYLDDRQVVLSTHSSTVIDHVDADEIRLVTRSAGKTSLDVISAPDMERLKTFLHHEGELADFVFEGGLQ